MRWLDHTVPENGCLIWTRCFNSDGYPRAGVKGNSNVKVHREVFFECNGYYPPVVRHLCDNIRCINPQHLLGGTHEDNMKDRKERGRIPFQVLDSEVTKCVKLREEGLTHQAISETLNCSKKRVEYILTRSRKVS